MSEDEFTSDECPTEPSSIDELINGSEVISLLQELVRINSPYFEEEEITEFVFQWLSRHDLNPQYHRVNEPDITGYEGRNVVARLSGTDDTAPTLLLNAHMDTVKISENWEKDPLSGRVEGGKLYGQGAADMKAGLAASMIALRTLDRLDYTLGGDLLFTAVVDEEGPYGLGTDQLIRDGVIDDCDMAIVPEPGPILSQDELSNPALILGARGRFLYDIQVRGQPGHAATPHGSINAVVDSGQLASAVTELPVDTDPRLGSGSICPLLIQGGSETLSVPDRCRLLVDRHVVFNETIESVKTDLEELVSGMALSSSVEIGFREVPHPEARYRPYITDENHPLVEALRQSSQRITNKNPSEGYFASVGDFNYLGDRAGLPTVIIGPDGGNIHSAGEYVSTDDTVVTTQIIADAALNLLT